MSQTIPKLKCAHEYSTSNVSCHRTVEYMVERPRSLDGRTGYAMVPVCSTHLAQAMKTLSVQYTVEYIGHFIKPRATK